MHADVSPPRPIWPSLNSYPRYALGHPKIEVEVIESPLHLNKLRIALNLFALMSYFYFLNSSLLLFLESYWETFLLAINLTSSLAHSQSSTIALMIPVKLAIVHKSAHLCVIAFASQFLNTLILIITTQKKNSQNLTN